LLSCRIAGDPCRSWQLILNARFGRAIGKFLIDMFT
jgi:hypothetical protein